MTNSNPKSLLKLYKYNYLRLSSTEMNNIFIQSQAEAEETPVKKTPRVMVTLEMDSDKDEKNI